MLESEKFRRNVDDSSPDFDYKVPDPTPGEPEKLQEKTVEVTKKMLDEKKLVEKKVEVVDIKAYKRNNVEIVKVWKTS